MFIQLSTFNPLSINQPDRMESRQLLHSSVCFGPVLLTSLLLPVCASFLAALSLEGILLAQLQSFHAILSGGADRRVALPQSP